LKKKVAVAIQRLPPEARVLLCSSARIPHKRARGNDRTSCRPLERLAVWIDKRQTGFFASMDLSSFGSLLGSLSLDDSSIALIALLAGMTGGWLLTNWWDQQLRTKKLKANRKS